MILAMLLAAGSCPLVSHAPPAGVCHYDHGGPDRVCTPGETDTEDVADLCATLTQERRCKPDAALRRALLAAYGTKKAGEIDHLIPICLGGAQSVRNLWPQQSPQFKVKDKLEARLCREICSGKVSLPAARSIVTNPKNWH